MIAEPAKPASCEILGMLEPQNGNKTQHHWQSSQAFSVRLEHVNIDGTRSSGISLV